MESTPEQRRPIEVFIAYARKDKELQNELAGTWLELLKQEGLITVWHDQMISPGGDWQKIIDEHLRTAQLILLLISQDFMVSAYCSTVEMKQAMERHEAKTAHVIPIILRPADWKHPPIDKLQALPRESKPITKWQDRDEAFLDIVDGIRKAIQELNTQSVPQTAQQQADGAGQLPLSASDQLQTTSLPSSGPLLSPPASIDATQRQVFPAITFAPPLTPLPPVHDPAESAPSSTPNPALTAAGPTGSQRSVKSASSSSGQSGPSTTTPHPFWPGLPSRKWIISGSVLCLFLVIFFLVVYINVSLPTPWCSITLKKCPSVHEAPLGIGVTRIGQEDIGLSDGKYVFDGASDRLDVSLKLQAAEKLQKFDFQHAQMLLQQAVQKDTNDAEAYIYKEDIRVLTSGHPYITFVVATMLTGSNAQIGRGDLQGAFIAQQEFNSSRASALTNNLQVRLLIANSGSADEGNATKVAQQIIQAARTDKTIVGVIGWPFSQSSINAIKVLAAAHIPMVSQAASSNLLTGLSPYFFRVNPTDTQQGIVGAMYAEKNLHAKRVALFVDPTNPYSRSLAQAFCQAFTGHIPENANDFCLGFSQNGNAIVAVENYMVKKPDTVNDHVQEALDVAPDLVYLAGYYLEAAKLLQQTPGLKLMGGDALYNLRNFQANHYPADASGRLFFTEFAFADEWLNLCQHHQTQACSQPPFFCEYARTFDPNLPCPSSKQKYDFNRPSSDAMLTYDAMLSMLAAVINIGKQRPTSDELRQALTQISGSRAIQGVSGRISFGLDRDPTNKAVVILRVDTNLETKIDAVQGCFFTGGGCS